MDAGSLSSGAVDGSVAEVLSLDEAFDVLAHRRRRHAVSALADETEPVPLTRLASDVATREYNRPMSDISARKRRDVYTTLYHTHVPKLAAADVVTFDRECDLVGRTDAVARLEGIVAAAADRVGDR